VESKGLKYAVCKVNNHKPRYKTCVMVLI